MLNHVAGVLLTDISDHLPVFLIIDALKDRVQNKKNYKKRYFTDNNTQCFINDLNATDWDVITLQDNVHGM